MRFSEKKLPSEAAGRLRNFSIDAIEPFALMASPAYVYMPRNGKFVCVKGPLDFFTPEELQRLRPYSSLFLSPFLDQAEDFLAAGRRLRTLLSWRPISSKVPLPPSPFEISDAALRLLAPLWGRERWIEPFFATLFTNALCGNYPSKLLKNSRDRDVRNFEQAILLAGWTIYLAVLAGYCQLEFLESLRLSLFNRYSKVENQTQAHGCEDLVEFARISFLEVESSQNSRISIEALINGSAWSPCRIQSKLAARLRRSDELLNPKTFESATVFGERGLIHA